MTVTNDRSTAVLAVLFAGAFMMGSAEELLFGMLDLIAEGLLVSVPTAGALVTGIAVGLALGGPLLTLLTRRLSRRTVLLSAAAAFVLLNLLPVLVDSYAVFLVSRVVIGAVQGLFIAAAITTATRLAPPDRAGRAMAVVISGFAAASALGLPLFTLLGQTWGWRASFVAVVAAGTGVLVAAALVLPSLPTTPESRGAGEQLRTALAPRVLAVLALCCLVFAGIQSALTYLVPYLGDVTGVTGPGVTVFLLVYGVASLIGSLTGGWFADLDAGRTLIVGSIGLSGSLLALYLLGGNPVLAAAAVLCVGLCAGVAPSLQHRVETFAGPGAPFAASLPASAVYVGIAVGSVAGGVAIDRVGIPAAVLTGAVLAVFATAVALLTSRLRPAAAHEERGSAS